MTWGSAGPTWSLGVYTWPPARPSPGRRKEDDLTTNWNLLALQVSKVFTPAAPVDKAQLFAGRTTQVRKVVDAISQRGQHAIIFGERGVGKTSLANVIADLLQDLGDTLLTPHINCDSGDDFNTLWHKVFHEVRLVQEIPSAGFGEGSREDLALLADRLPKRVTTGDIRRLLAPVAAEFVVVIILDEFDRLPSGAVRAMVADTIKMLSDHSEGVTLVLLGVADSVDELIAEHQSVERSLVQIPMPRMSPDELKEILTKGLGSLDMNADERALGRITNLSRGLPHYTHLLGLHSARQAIDRHSLTIEANDVELAIQRALDDATQSTKSAYYTATRSQKKDALYRQALLACALTETDSLGYFQPADVREHMADIIGEPVTQATYHNHLREFCEPERASILQRTGGERKWRYRFGNPLMQPFVIMKGYTDGMIGTLEE